MYLKKLEIYGFKSFADKAILNFEKGITAIVGPNGSGKSNISDAIRLVLGEQSIKNLRGSRLEDVIFAGSETRKPLGFCEINLTLDNSDGSLPFDYNEVVITRRIFRSGESEFFINKIPCRLKDVHELFLDTGIGKEGYSVIGQGKIDEILSAKPEERRLIVEEAIGISKYRYKKEEAEKKLVSAEENLIRLNDIVVELEKQLEVLGFQKEKAEKFLTFKEEKKKAEVALYAQLAAKAFKKYEELKNQYEFLAQKLEEKTKEKEAEEKKFLALEKELGRLKKKLEEEKDRYHVLLRDIEIISGQKELLLEKSSNLKENFRRYEEELQKLQGKKLFLESEIKKAKERIMHLKENRKNFLEKLDRMKKVQEEMSKIFKEREEEIEKAKADMIEILNSIAEINGRISLNRSLKEEAEKKKEDLALARRSLEQRLKDMFLEGQELEGKERSLEELYSKYEEEVKIVEEELKKLEEILNEKEKALKEVNVKKDKALSRLLVLEEMEKNYEGYSDTVKKLFKRTEKKGIIGLVGELIEVEEDYRQAIEVALGFGIQNVVVENAQKAAELIKILKRDGLGRLTFLPLDLVRGKKLEGHEVFKEKGVIGLASSLIKYAPFLEGIFDFLLGRTVVVDRIETAIYLAKKYDQAFRIVTLEGEVVNVGGAITGGNWKSTNGSILSRKNEMKELKSEIENLLGIEEKLKKEIERIGSEIEIYKSQLKDLENKAHTVRRELEPLKQNKIFIEKEIESLKEKIEDSLVEEKEVAKNIYYYKEEIEKGLSRLKALEAEKNSLEDLMKSFNDKNVQNKSEISSLEKQVTEVKIELAKLEEKLQNELSNLEEKEKEFSETVQTIGEKERQIEDIKVLIGHIREEIEEKEKNLSLLKEEAEKSKVYLDSLEQKVFEEEKNSHNDREKFLLLQEEYNTLKEKIHYLEMGMQRFQMEIDNIKERLYQEYSLTLEEVEVEGKEDITKLRMEVDRLNEEIKKLGNINLDSIEEYKQVKERYDFLKSQMEDIIRARESLIRVIDETGKIMRMRFKDGFEVLNTQFKETFKRLFGGGDAKLVLTDEKNLLTTGVEIKAQPPGKKLQNLSLLSGGEKALVAISLLFAMLTMKPTPFCVLDEIDAALDEANVDRFVKALKELSKEMQFIVVTHRRGTMLAADAIYGVTMQEKGVSKILSIKLNTEDRSGGLFYA